MPVSRALICLSSIIVILLLIGRETVYAVNPDPILDNPGITIKGDGNEDIQFGNFAAGHPIEANVTAQLNSTVFKVSTDWFEINSSLLAPTVIEGWAYNYTYKFATPWINTTSPVGFGAKYSANYLVNVSTISTGLKFYQVSGTYITAHPHYYSANQTLRFLTNGNPTTVNVFAGTNGMPTVVKANGVTVTLGSGWTWDATNHIVHITNVGTRFAISWQSLSTTTEKVTVTMGAGPAATITIGGSCSPSISTFPADGTQHTFTANSLCAITYNPPANSTNIRYIFVGNHGSVGYTTAASGTETFSYTLYEQLQNTYQASPTSNGNLWDFNGAILATGSRMGSAATATINAVSGSGAASVASFFDYNTLVTLDATHTVSGTEQWVQSGGNTFTQTTGGNTNNVNYVRQWLLTMAASPGNCGSTAPTTTFENDGATVGGISATPVTGCAFTAWTGTGSGSYTGTANPTTVTMNAAITETAGFSGTPLGFCTTAQNVVKNGSNSFQLLISLFFVMAGGTVVVALAMIGSRDTGIIMPLAFLVLLIGTVIILVAILYGATSVANNTTLYGIGCAPQ